MTKRKHRFRLKEIERLIEFDPIADSPKGRRLKRLALMAQFRERRWYKAWNKVPRASDGGGK